MKFDINNYKGKYVMHCKTEAEAIAFCDYLHSIGKTWLNGASYAFITNWDEDSESICYNFNHGMSGPKGFYRSNKYYILEFADFIWSTEFTKADLKDGMIVEYVSGEKRLVFNKKFIGTDSYSMICNYTDDLKSTSCPSCSIQKVYYSNANYVSHIMNSYYLTLIWERKEEPKPVEMTIEEICKALGKEIKIVKG